MTTHSTFLTRGFGRTSSARLLLLVLFACLAGSGCQSPNGTRAAGTGIGAILGGTAGYFLGGTQGAVIGAAAGGLAGLGVGQLIYKKQVDLETRKKLLAVQVTDAGKVLEQHRSYNEYLSAKLKEIKDALQKIQDSETNQKITPEQAKKLRQDLVPTIDATIAGAKETAAAFAVADDKVKAALPADPNADSAALDQKMAKLQLERKQLDDQEKQLSELLDSLAAERKNAAGQ